MTMTKNRRGSRGRAEQQGGIVKALVQAEVVEDVLAAAKPGIDVITRLRADRKALSQQFADLCDAQAGDRGDQSVSYTQKMHWALLDLLGLHSSMIEAAMLLLPELARAIEDGELARRKEAEGRFSLDDLHVEQVDDRNVRLALVRGDDEASFTLKFPVVIDRGTWSDRARYERGDAVTFRGSLWVAKQDDPAAPEGPESGWRLAVKKGRDSKEVRP